MSKYMYRHTKLPAYLPMPRFLMNLPISNTAKLLYTQFLGKAQLSQKNAWVDSQSRVYFIYPIHQIAVDMNKSETTIKDVMRELVETQLLEKIPEGRGRPNRLYILFPDTELGQKSDVGKLTLPCQKTDSNYVGKSTASKYKSKNTSNLLRDYDYEEEASF